MNKLYFFFSILILVSCAEQQSTRPQATGKQYFPETEEAMSMREEMSMDQAQMESTRTAEPEAPSEINLETGSKIIKNGRLDFEVSNLEKSKVSVDKLVANYKGYFENESFNAYGNRHSYSLYIRVPNEKFDSLITDLEKGIGKLTAKTISADDVTEEYVDLNIRLENNLAYLNQYKEILRKAKTVKDIIEVQEKIRRIEEEIESKKGRIQFLDDRVKYSALHVQLSELTDRDFSNRPSFGRRISNAFKNGVDVFLSFLVGLVNLWPFLILAIILFLFRKGIINLFRRK